MRRLILARVIGLVAVPTFIVAVCFVAFSLLSMARKVAEDHFEHARI
jgi:hypothetical protein